MSDDIAIKVENLSKCYPIFAAPRDRLKQMILPRLFGKRGEEGRRYYREFWALKDVSFELKRGEAVGIVGRNGSGKSTLLQIICGTLNPSLGNVFTDQRISALLELGSGFNPEFSGRENVYLNGALLGLAEADIDRCFESIAKFADIGTFMEQPVKTYSSGMIVRLAFAVAVNSNPSIFIIDEALAVGDELFQRKCFARIEEIRASGATILFVSHSGAQVVQLCDRAILLDDGELLCIGPAKNTVTAYQKLLYAPQERRAEIRATVVSENACCEATYPSNLPTAVRAADSGSGEKENHEEFFDPHLISQNAIEYESHGPIIDTPSISTLDGRKVNALITGRKYRYSYAVVFERPAASIRFGMSIRTPSGLALGGAMSAPDLATAVPAVSAHQTCKVEFIFQCNFNPGVYFMNAGVFGIMHSEEVVLHRRVDVVAFRVLPSEKTIETGLAFLHCQPTVTVK